MDKYEERRLALAALVKKMGRGAIGTIATRIEKDASYVSRMLYPLDKPGHKRIGEDTLDLLRAAYPEHFADPNTNAPRQMFTKERRASDDALAVQIGLESLAVALLQRVPGSASAFLEDVRRVAKGHRFSLERGFLGALVEIADGVQRAEEEATRALQRAGSARRTKRGK